MKRLITLAALVLSIVACKKEAPASNYTADNLGSTYWDGMDKTENVQEAKELSCELYLYEEGKAELSFTYSRMTKAMFIEMAKLSGTWSVKNGKLALRLTKDENDMVDDLPWTLTGLFLDEPTDEVERMMLEIPNRGTVLLIGHKFIKIPIPLEPDPLEGGHD